MMDIHAIADRLEINDVLIRYGTALDTRDSALLETCFTEDAVLEYDAAPAATRAEFAERAGRLHRFAATQHIITNVAVTLDGDRASSTSYAHAQHVRGESEGRETYLMGGTYTDQWVRTGLGWRIAHRRFACSWAVKGIDVMTPAHDKLPAGA